MSLVAYNSSDESDGDSEGKISTAVQKQSKSSAGNKDNSESGHISDEEEYEAVSSSTISTTSTTLPVSFSASRVGHGSHSSSNTIDSTSVTSLEDLPVPQSSNRSTISEEDELEDEVKPKAAEIEGAQKPPPKRKPVKITIPSLEKTSNDDDDRDAKGKPTPSTKKSGLFSLLPPPVNSVKKEINRPLIPHTLTKKMQPTATSKNSEKPVNTSKSPSKPIVSTSVKGPSDFQSGKSSLNIAMYGSDSDDDEEENGGVNFFSLNSSVKHTEERVGTDRLQSEEVSSSAKTDIKTQAEDIGKTNKSTKPSSYRVDEKDSTRKPTAVINSGPEPGAINDAPLDFGLRAGLSSSVSAQGYLGAVGLAGPASSGQSYQVAHGLSASAQYNLANVEVTGDEFNDGDDFKQMINEREFQRLSGKRKRGMEEAINFVDANVDDYVDPSEVSKHLTEETEYVSHKNKDNMPTAQQRRKKQITYLAYQAKERELELKNNWAQNRMTKKQTQSKYGF